MEEIANILLAQIIIDIIIIQVIIDIWVVYMMWKGENDNNE